MYFDKSYRINISKVISDKYIFYAHINADKKETLKEHTELADKYFDKINKAKGLEKIFSNFENSYLKDVNEESKKVFRKLLINTVTFHDIGKINPLFQYKKMNNEIKEEKEFSGVDSEHSIISAVLYIDYFIDSIAKISNKTDRNKIIPFLFLNAYVISKHHGDLNKFQAFIEKFDEDKKAARCIEIFNNNYVDIYIKKFCLSSKKIKKVLTTVKEKISDKSVEEEIYLCVYEKLLFSLLVACDFYATTEFMSGVEISEFGEINEIEEFYDVYRETEIYKRIRAYEVKSYRKEKNLIEEKNINVLRTEMFLDAEKELEINKNENIFFLEAPTGSGKSNVSMNLSFKLLEHSNDLKKIIYVYPFNTLVEQNINSLEKIFGDKEEVFNKIAVINSIYPIKMDEKEKYNDENEDNYKYYAKALLNRQFLNYPMILTTHVSLFNTMFNASKEASFGFYQLVNSVIVLDEIQSYKNTIWTEIILFLKSFAKILNIKVIIMSATLPDLNLLDINKGRVVKLINDREKYFSNPLFKDRVEVNYNLIDKDKKDVYEHVKDISFKKKKILIEFIKKSSAYEFYRDLKEDIDIQCRVELMTGDDNCIERERILREVNKEYINKMGIILVATQVIEAGVDIDMDIGYKDISKLDSDEQFMGRINRSCRRNGAVYFFNLDDVSKIYKNDVRVNSSFSLMNEKMREILVNKKFSKYYTPVLEAIKEIYNESISDSNIKKFFNENVGNLEFKEIEKRMELIEEDRWSMSIYLSSVIEKEDGTIINGEKVWENYKSLLIDEKMNYAKKRVELFKVRSLMNNFIYTIVKNENFTYNDKIGELYFIEDGQKYFEDGKLDKEKFIQGIGDFL